MIGWMFKKRVSAPAAPAPREYRNVGDLRAELNQRDPGAFLLASAAFNDRYPVTNFSAVAHAGTRRAVVGDAAYVSGLRNVVIDNSAPMRVYIDMQHEITDDYRQHMKDRDDWATVNDALNALLGFPHDLEIVRGSVDRYLGREPIKRIDCGQFSHTVPMEPSDPGYLPGNRKYKDPGYVDLDFR